MEKKEVSSKLKNTFYTTARRCQSGIGVVVRAGVSTSHNKI